MARVARFHCRADLPMPHLVHITLSGRNCSCWIVLRRSRNSTAHGSHVRSDSRVSHTHPPLTRRKMSRELMKKGHSYEPQISSGQLGDPHYLRKANALYYEFEEIGLNRQFGYESPADIVDKYPRFYWNNISPHIQTAI